jgi:hypothetical protein
MVATVCFYGHGSAVDLIENPMLGSKNSNSSHAARPTCLARIFEKFRHPSMPETMA